MHHVGHIFQVLRVAVICRIPDPSKGPFARRLNTKTPYAGRSGTNDYLMTSALGAVREFEVRATMSTSTGPGVPLIFTTMVVPSRLVSGGSILPTPKTLQQSACMNVALLALLWENTHLPILFPSPQDSHFQAHASSCPAMPLPPTVDRAFSIEVDAAACEFAS